VNRRSPLESILRRAYTGESIEMTERRRRAIRRMVSLGWLTSRGAGAYGITHAGRLAHERGEALAAKQRHACSIEHVRTGIVAGTGTTADAAWLSAASRGVTGGADWQIVPWRPEHAHRLMQRPCAEHGRVPCSTCLDT